MQHGNPIPAGICISEGPRSLGAHKKGGDEEGVFYGNELDFGDPAFRPYFEAYLEREDTAEEEEI